jgi:flagellar protein FlgJ
MFSSVASAPARHQPQPNAALVAKAKELEGVFLNTLTSQMFSSIKTDGMFGGGFGEETWRSMQSEQMADSIAQSGGVGLAADITRNLLDAQEAAQATTTPQGAAQQ